MIFFLILALQRMSSSLVLDKRPISREMRVRALTDSTCCLLSERSMHSRDRLKRSMCKKKKRTVYFVGPRKPDPFGMSCF